MTTLTLYHGTHHDDLPVHPGLCLADSVTAARGYGESLYEIDIDLDGLVVEDVECDAVAIRRTGDEFPCDSKHELVAYVARGVDIIRFSDVADRIGSGLAHVTYRLLSPAALDRVLYCSVE